MNTLKLNSSGEQVKRLCQLLGIEETTKFTSEVQRVVKEFQSSNGLGVDGIVGPKSWIKLFTLQRQKLNSSLDINLEDYNWAAEFLGCEPLVLRALVNVETGGKSGFDAPNQPQILFEGHVFWKELKSIGVDPESVQQKYPSICYPSWTTKFYLGGIKEWQRFDIASVINKECAMLSTSYGLFQIMGKNYKSCGADSIQEFYDGMCKSPFQQFIYGIQFLRSSGIYTHLGTKDWKEISRLYNGSQNTKNYSEKLQSEYNNLLNNEKSIKMDL